ncbi:CaiB/BaiF CoA transferase family protein [Limibacillus halophilus]|uniref:Crotonobetainyl-CoA:carnitine CoA-transferase CaiB-like acyl-CoA transferase n=1 Tax=Limibacillus halophilus TaxID=1579333 RepID=A0A839SU23_9PROT|nr:CoA transferase [Limibacillus halophilus]MBB3065992.1 crotonobetainyl-CoA:carnitine CoA-transferase CaiB-like acyl-CoA transferase [Limibacillus halophilus]
MTTGQKSQASGPIGPLAGIRVLELGQIAAGPFTGSLMADLGADVVKVERPDGGDGMRNWPPLSKPSEGEAYSENFASLNRNKRSIALDLKDPGDRQALKTLVSSADVLLENYRPGVLDRLELGYEALSAINPRIIYCSISGYGQQGPNASKGAFDVTVQAMAGIMSVTGEDGAPPVKCGVPVGDFCAGLYAAFSIVSVMREVERTGIGKRIDCSMVGSLLGVSALQSSEFFGSGEVPKRLGSAHPRNAPYQAFKAADDYFVIAAGNDRLWKEVCDAVGLPNIAVDPRFLTQADRARNQVELVKLLAPEFLKKSASAWLVEMDSRNVPCAPINNFEQILNDPQIKYMGLVCPLRLPNGVETQTVKYPVGISGYDLGVYRNPPELGEHNAEVLSEWTKTDPSKE